MSFLIAFDWSHLLADWTQLAGCAKVQSDEDFVVSDDHDGARSIASSEQGGSAGAHKAQVGPLKKPNAEAQARLLH